MNKRKLSILSVLPLLLVASTALALIGPPLKVQVPNLGAGAETNKVNRFTVTLTATAPVEMEAFELEGEGWTVMSLDAPPKVSLLAGETVDVSFTAIPSRDDTQLLLRAVVNGEVVSLGVDVTARSARFARGPQPGRKVDETPPAFTVDPQGIDDIRLPVEVGTQPSQFEEGEDRPTAAKAPRNIRVRGNIGYYRDDNAWLSVDRCIIHIWEDDADPNPDDFIISGETDALGNFDITFFWDAVSEAEPDIYVVYWLDGIRVKVQPVGGTPYGWGTTVWTNYTGTDLQIGGWTSGDPALYPAMALHTNLHRTWRWIYTRGPWDGPKVTGVFPDASAPTGWYSNNEIHMDTGVQWEEDTMSHEWGHHWAANFATLNNDTYCNGICDFSGCGHCGWCQETQAVAWNEGFANLLGDLCPKLWGPIYGEPALHIGDIYEFESLVTCWVDNQLDPADITEGFVAALLRDIVDTTNDNHPQFAGSDQLGLDWDEVLTTVDLDHPQTVYDFLGDFVERYPQHFTGLNETAKDCGLADTFQPGAVTNLTTTSHSFGLWSTDVTIDYTWTEPTDVWSGVNAYDVAWNNGSHVFPGFTPDLGDVTNFTTPSLLTGEWFFSVYPRDRAGNWAQFYWWVGPIKILGADGPDLEPLKPPAWTYPLLPRSSADASWDSAPISATLPGNSAGTYLNDSRYNSGGVATVGTGPNYLTQLLIDGGVRLTSSGGTPVAAGGGHHDVNSGPHTVAGGRHTVHMNVDSGVTEPENDEGNNQYGRQWIWTPLLTTAGNSYVRSAPSIRNAGHGAIPAGSQTIYDNVDGLRLNTSGDYWDALVLNPGANADYDLQMHSVLSTGSQSGFAAPVLTSDLGGGALDIVLVNRNNTGGQFDVGVLNYSGSSSSYTAQHVTADADGVLELGDQVTFALDANKAIDLREMYTLAGESGLGQVYLVTEPPTANVELRWYGPGTTTDSIIGQDRIAFTNGAGTASIDLGATQDNTYSLLMVTRHPYAGTSPVQVTLKLRAPLSAQVMGAVAQPVSVVSIPDGSGNALTAAFQWNGVPGNPPTEVDASFTVEVRDANTNAAVAGFPREDIRLVRSGVVACSGLWADANTDLAGQTTFSLPLTAGGFTSAPLEVVLVDVPSPVITGVTNIRTNSPDMNGDLVVNLTDLGTFSADYGGAYNYRSDFRWDGVVNLSDVGLFASGYGAGCEPGKATPQLEGEVAASEDQLMLTFDEAGVVTEAGLPVGQSLTAYLSLTGPAAREGVTAWEASIQTSSNVRITSTSLPRGALDIGDNGDHRVGTGGLVRSESGEPLRLMTLTVTVTDDRPARLWVRSASTPALAHDVPVLAVGESGALRTVLAQGTHAEGAAATINDGVTAEDLGQLTRGLNLRATPNPFNPATEIRFDLARRGQAEVRIFDVSGRLVRRLGSGMMEAGANALRWNGTDAHGEPVVSGVYFYRLVLDGQEMGTPQRMTLLK